VFVKKIYILYVCLYNKSNNKFLILEIGLMEDLKGNLLVVDDDVKVIEALELFLDVEFKMVKTASNPNTIPEILRTNEIHIVLLDMNFNAGRNTGNEGLYWLRQIKEINKNIEVVMFTAYGDVELVVNCIKEGAFDFIVKPWDNQKLISTLKAALKMYQANQKLQHLKNVGKQLLDDLSKPFQTIIGDSPGMQHVFNIISKVAETDANVLVIGENGTGKELVARELHNKSKRRSNPFIRVDVGSLSENLIESELFGHVKGAFTDAKSDRVGRFQTASKGTLFLDEIGNIPLQVQQKLLTAIERREIVPVGSNKVIPVDIRLICATNINLEEKVRNSLFREDLLYRINTILIKLPALRERGDDISKLAEFFLNKNVYKYKKPDISFSKDAKRALKNYSWPGNVRELEHVVEKSVILCQGKIITTNDLGISSELNIEDEVKQRKSLDDIEKQAIVNSLNLNFGNLSEVAKELKITRQTLYNKIRKYKIQI